MTIGLPMWRSERSRKKHSGVEDGLAGMARRIVSLLPAPGYRCGGSTPWPALLLAAGGLARVSRLTAGEDTPAGTKTAPL